MNSKTVLIATILAMAATAVQAAQKPPFSDYPARIIYRGPVIYPDFHGRDRDANLYRTRIKDGIRNGATFAGKYAVITFGCGTGCVAGYVVDVSNGYVHNLPLYGEPYQGLDYTFQVDSTLINARWYDMESEQCIVQSFNLKNDSYDLISKQVAKVDYAGCFSPTAN